MWSVEEERELRKLVSGKNSVETIAAIMKKTEKAVYTKLYLLGLLLKEEANKKHSSSSYDFEKIRKEMPTPKEALELLSNCVGRLGLEVVINKEIP